MFTISLFFWHDQLCIQRWFYPRRMVQPRLLLQLPGWVQDQVHNFQKTQNIRHRTHLFLFSVPGPFHFGARVANNPKILPYTRLHSKDKKKSRTHYLSLVFKNVDQYLWSFLHSFFPNLLWIPRDQLCIQRWFYQRRMVRPCLLLLLCPSQGAAPRWRSPWWTSALASQASCTWTFRWVVKSSLSHSSTALKKLSWRISLLFHVPWVSLICFLVNPFLFSFIFFT